MCKPDGCRPLRNLVLRTCLGEHPSWPVSWRMYTHVRMQQSELSITGVEAMNRDESSPKAHRRRAIAGLFCCCSIPSKTPEPDSRVVRMTAGIIAIIAMLLSGVGFSALQRATVNPYESLFITASSSRHLAPAAWDGPSAFAPSPQLMLPSAGFVSAEGTSQGPPIESAVSGQAWVSPGGGTAPHAGRFSNAAMAPSPAQSMDNTANKGDLAAVPTASGPSQDTADPGSQGTASVESAVPNSLSSPAPSPARLGATLDQGVIGTHKCGINCTLQSVTLCKQSVVSC